MSSDRSGTSTSGKAKRPNGRKQRPKPGRSRPTRVPTLPALLSAAVEKNPTGTALVFGETSVTYEELDGQSSKLARLLISHGVGPDHLVAIALDRSIESVASVWAVAKSGGAFLPIDLRYPPGRIEHMVTDSGVRWGLTTSDRVEASCPTECRGSRWTGPDEKRQLESIVGRAGIAPQDRLAQPVPANLAYVIYTSGSTGRPKGVAVTHAGLAPLAATVNDTFETSGDSRTMHFASPSFDASVLELLISIVNGSMMVIVPSGIYGGTELTEIMAEHRVTHAIITPAALTTMYSGDLPELRALAVGGETLHRGVDGTVGPWSAVPQRLRSYRNDRHLQFVRPRLAPGGAVDIGSPTQSMAGHVLDDRLRPVPGGCGGGAVHEWAWTGPRLSRAYGAHGAAVRGQPLCSRGGCFYIRGCIEPATWFESGTATADPWWSTSVATTRKFSCAAFASNSGRSTRCSRPWMGSTSP
ncbi:MAG: AMP-binding protein [Rhodococcus sp. (in: high G+C Gram-positive bacteria)]|uniref:AMP-binding protein n=1 Tax=Rhodococcus sp. TaxID=1831 RepID=UPI002AD5FF66|nr:AMP-binding protein [Rhodococcus sp. (in: high G+C Gram-positive bacteria)]